MAQSLEANSRKPPDESQLLTDGTGKLNIATVSGMLNGHWRFEPGWLSPVRARPIAGTD